MTPGAAGGPRPAVEFPAEHRLSHGYSVAFAVPAARLGHLLSADWLGTPLGPGWKPAPLGAGYGVLAVAYHDFSASPVGPYRQTSLAVALHVGSRGQGIRGLPLLPILWQSLGGNRPLFPTLGLAVVLLVATTTEAVTYSRRLWGEPAFPGGVEITAGRAGGRGLELATHLEGPPGFHLRVAVPAQAPAAQQDRHDPNRAGSAESPAAPGAPAARAAGSRSARFPGREDRRYRLFSHVGGETLGDYMHVRAPCRRSLVPRRGTLAWTAPGRTILKARPLCLMVTEYGPGSVVFGGPRRL